MWGAGSYPLRPASSLGSTMSIIPEVERAAPDPFTSSSKQQQQQQQQPRVQWQPTETSSLHLITKQVG